MSDTTKHNGPRYSFWVPAPNQNDPNGEPGYVRSEAAFHSTSAAALATVMSLALGVETGTKDEGMGECTLLFVNATTGDPNGKHRALADTVRGGPNCKDIVIVNRMRNDPNYKDLVAAVGARMRKCRKDREVTFCATHTPEMCMKLCPHRDELVLFWAIHRHWLKADAEGADAQQTEEDSNMLEVAMAEIRKLSMPAKGGKPMDERRRG
jgi:hypothetical protein